MFRMSISAMLASVLAVGFSPGCGETEDGPVIDSGDINVRNLSNRSVSVEVEKRCLQDNDCTGGQNQTCWFSEAEHFLDKKGFCRECLDDGGCPGTTRCDHGWCHQTCGADADCGAGEFCTKNFCRKPHLEGTEFSICNKGNRELEVYLDRVALYGNRDACAFSRIRWSVPEEVALISPSNCNLFLSTRFTPPDVGEFYAVLEIPSNAINVEKNPLYIVLCGQAVESVCSVSEDRDCPSGASCLQKDFIDILEEKPVPDCQGYFY